MDTTANALKQTGSDFLQQQVEQWQASNPTEEFNAEALFQEVCKKNLPVLSSEWMVLTIALVDLVNARDALPVNC